MVFPFDGIDNGKVGLNGASVFILKHFHTLILKPVFLVTILVSGYSRSVSFALLRNPVDTVNGALIVGDSSQPVVDDKVILQAVFPDNRVLKFPVHVRIHTSVTYLLIGRDTIFTNPYPSSTTYHQIRTVTSSGKGQVRQPLNDFSVSLVEGEMTVRPRPIQAVRNVISVNNVHYGASVF